MFLTLFTLNSESVFVVYDTQYSIKLFIVLRGFVVKHNNNTPNLLFIPI